MTPSENEPSAFARIPFILDLYNRYFFNVEEKRNEWVFRGAQGVHRIETEVAIPLLKELGQAKYVNLRPLSGLSCSQIVLRAFGGGIDSNILAVAPEQGGHHATEDLAKSVGLHIHYMKGIDEHTIDLDFLEHQLKERFYHLVYVDQSTCLFPVDIEKMVRIIRKVSPKTMIHVDMSHYLGLVFGKAKRNPLALGADSYAGSTHKTFPGPQKAVFFTDNHELMKKFDQTQYYVVSSHHFGAVASLALSLMEFKECGGYQYSSRVLENAKTLAHCLDELGYEVSGKQYGFTDCHQIWVSTSRVGMDSFEASERLFDVGIRVNAYPSLPGMNEPSLRIGVNEITKQGAEKEEILQLAEIMDAAIRGTSPQSELRKRVQGIRTKKIEHYGYSLKNSELKELCSRLLGASLGGVFDREGQPAPIS
ncbi:aminotransferase class V-fold PLP-dependent enzyme [Brevibacillus ruminantium]|uniref:Aminotransferase class V-fold PLP-dependent enzyme n=2 Tax=Brevibacillus ruminantium TaxID=2950604 RepID=A0ABY4WPA2_9BACL|nr:aminotransferase class V-fold PLP-dependent enzyme [Brevibacillus ruminantium]